MYNLGTSQKIRPFYVISNFDAERQNLTQILMFKSHKFDIPQRIFDGTAGIFCDSLRSGATAKMQKRDVKKFLISQLSKLYLPLTASIAQIGILPVWKVHHCVRWSQDQANPRSNFLPITKISHLFFSIVLLPPLIHHPLHNVETRK